MRSFRHLAILLLLAGLPACEEAIEWPLPPTTAELLVVEGIMTNELKRHSLRLARLYGQPNGTPRPVSGAQVSIRAASGTLVLNEEPPGSGLYLTDTTRFVSNQLYTLIITYEGRTYQATDVQPPVEPLDSLQYYAATDTSYALGFAPSGEAANYIHYELSWEATLSCPAGNRCRAAVIYYDLKNIDIQAQFAPEQEQVTFPAGTRVIRSKYSVSDAYREFLRGMLSETAWRGGFFDAYPANAPTNLSTGATGFFAVSTVVRDTVVVK